MSSNPTDILCVSTNNKCSLFGKDAGNSSFRVMESLYGDAPPVGQWIGLSKVNLIYGKLDQSDNDKQ